MSAVPELLRAAPVTDSCREEAISFPVGGETVRAIWSEPRTGTPDGAVLLMHGWGGLRGGPHNLLAYLARRTAAEGYGALRFDFRGRGESDGAGEQVTLAEMAADALAALAYLQRERGIRIVVLAGICSGANIAIGILDRAPDVRALFLLSIYPFSEGDNFNRDAQRTVNNLKAYGDKLRRPETWRKLVRFEVDFRSVARVLFGHFRREEKRSDKALTGQAEASPLANLLRQRPPVQILYGDKDPDYQASRRYYQEFAEQHDYPIEIRALPGANHNFYSLEWKQQIGDALLACVAQCRRDT